jgi:hypothetical protein
MQCLFKGKEIWHKNNHNIDELSTDLGFSCSENILQPIGMPFLYHPTFWSDSIGQ